MAINPLSGISISLANQISRELYDYAHSYHTFVSLLAGLDNMYGVTQRMTKSEDLSGSAIRLEFRASLPVIQGSNSVTGSLASLALTPQTNFSIVAGEMGWSHYQMREDIRVSYLDHIMSNPKSVVPYIKEVAEASRNAVIQKLSEDMFPSTAVSTTNGIYSESRVMALAYALQNPGASYEYCGLDLNDSGYSGLRATVATTFGVASLSNIRKNFLIPLRHKMAKIDVGLVDTSVYDYMVTQAESRVVIEQQEKLVYGGEYVRYGGLIWAPESRMDALSSREMYVLDSSTWEFRQKGAFKDFKVIENPDTATLVTMLGQFPGALVCKSPRRNGRATGVTLS